MEPVLAPPATPPRVGLLASLGGIDRIMRDTATADPQQRWADQSGFDFNSEACNASGRFDICTPGDLSPDADAGSLSWTPFGIYATDVCTTMQSRDRDGRARRALAACASYQVAGELWTGDLAQANGYDNGWLASPESDVLSAGSGMTPTNALACLEEGLAACSCGARGMIHATRQVATLWAADGLIRFEAGLLLTFMDSVVVPDAGYTGSGPDGQAAAAGAVWAYATTMVQVRLSEVQVLVDLGAKDLVNTGVARAQQIAAVSWDRCCHLAVQVDAPACGIAGS